MSGAESFPFHLQLSVHLMNPIFFGFFLRAILPALLLVALVVTSMPFPVFEQVAALLGGLGLIAMSRRHRA